MARAIVNGPRYGKLQMLESTLSEHYVRVWWLCPVPGVRVYVKRETKDNSSPRSAWSVEGVPGVSGWHYVRNGPRSAANAARKEVLRVAKLLQRSGAA